MNPWICPKCGRVWGPMVTGCGNCNNAPIALPGTIPVVPDPNGTAWPLPQTPRITCTEGPVTSVDIARSEAAARHLTEREDARP